MVHIKDHTTWLPFPSPVCYGPHPTSQVVVSFIPCLFFYSRHFVPRTESFAFWNRRPSDCDRCLQFDHAQRFESTTDRFTLQLYSEFNWKYSQTGLLCSLCIYIRILWHCILTLFSISFLLLASILAFSLSFSMNCSLAFKCSSLTVYRLDRTAEGWTSSLEVLSSSLGMWDCDEKFCLLTTMI